MKKQNFSRWIFPAFITGIILGGFGYLSVVSGFEAYQLPIMALFTVILAYISFSVSPKKDQHL